MTHYSTRQRRLVLNVSHLQSHLEGYYTWTLTQTHTERGNGFFMGLTSHHIIQSEEKDSVLISFSVTVVGLRQSSCITN